MNGSARRCIHGEHAEAFCAALSRRTAECIPDARLAIIKGVKHDAPMRKPLELAEMILQFAERNAKPRHLAAVTGTTN